MDRPVWLGILFCIAFISSLPPETYAVKTAGTLYIELLKYTNDGGKLANGHCCDGKWMFCQRNGCDYKFTICADEPPLDSDVNRCRIGRKANAYGISNQNNVLFKSTIGDLQNPLKFVLSPQQLKTGKATLKVKVWDDDEVTKDDYVDYLPYILNLRHHQPTIYTLKSRTTLIIRVKIKCAVFMYGPVCDVYCKPRDDAWGRYNCHPMTGKKICKKGWGGTYCRQPRISPTSGPTPTSLAPNGDCDLIAKRGDVDSDTFAIKVIGIPKFRAWCDIQGGTGWTVIQRRVDNSVSFTHNWTDYKQGFGGLGVNTNYWMGLERLHHLTNQRGYKLLIIIQETRAGNKSYTMEANYTRFRVDKEANKYRLRVTGYSGNAGDALGYHNGEDFSTADRDNDKWRGNCAKFYKSGWWFKRCYRANLNGPYPNFRLKARYARSTQTIRWLSKRRDSIITRVVMKVAPSP